MSFSYACERGRGCIGRDRQAEEYAAKVGSARVGGRAVTDLVLTKRCCCVAAAAEAPGPGAAGSHPEVKSDRHNVHSIGAEP